MKKFINKLIERLEERQNDIAGNLSLNVYYSDGYDKGIEYAIEKVNELAEEYNKKQEHEVWLNGCDADTIFTMEMTNNEYEFLKRVSELANETSTYQCMPRLFLDESVKYKPPYTEGE